MAESKELQTLLEAVRAFAASAEETLSALGPDGAVGRLAYDFDEAYTAYVGQLSQLPSESFLEALQQVDQQLENMSDPADASKLWVRSAVKQAPEWEMLRILARDVLAAYEVA